MRIDVYLDGNDHPYKTLTPPEKFQLDTESLSDGPHQLRFAVTDDDGITSERTVQFTVQNGPSIAVHGIVDGDTVHGEISVLANAYGSKIGDEFEPLRIETPVPIPTWAWVLFLCVLAWGAGYLSLELNARRGLSAIVKAPANTAVEEVDTAKAPKEDWVELGAQVYGNNCASCHQVNGGGLAGVFPPLKGNQAVLDEDPTGHIKAIMNGLSNKVIDGVSYSTSMPPFGPILSDEEVAAVVNHERTNWGNVSSTITASDVQALRN